MAEKKRPRKRPSKAAAKSKIPSHQKTAPKASAPAPVDAGPAPEPSPPSDRYEGICFTVSKWKGMDNFECTKCAFSTLHRGDMLMHFAKEHVPAEVPERTVDTGLVTPDGSKITRVEPAKED